MEQMKNKNAGVKYCDYCGADIGDLEVEGTYSLESKKSFCDLECYKNYINAVEGWTDEQRRF
jgi:hypothetical protein